MEKSRELKFYEYNKSWNDKIMEFESNYMTSNAEYDRMMAENMEGYDWEDELNEGTLYPEMGDSSDEDYP